MTVPQQSRSPPFASKVFGYFPQAETIFNPAQGNLAGFFYVQDVRYAAGAGMRERPVSILHGFLKREGRCGGGIAFQDSLVRSLWRSDSASCLVRSWQAIPPPQLQHQRSSSIRNHLSMPLLPSRSTSKFPVATSES